MKLTFFILSQFPHCTVRVVDICTHSQQMNIIYTFFNVFTDSLCRNTFNLLGTVPSQNLDIFKLHCKNSFLGNMSQWVHALAHDGQLRWVGPEKGVLHLAVAAIVNAFWDLWAKLEQKPVWKLLVDMTPEQIVSLVDFR